MVYEPSPLVRTCLTSGTRVSFGHCSSPVARDHSTQHIAVAQSTMDG